MEANFNILKLIEEKQYKKIKLFLQDLNEVDIAHHLEQIEQQEDLLKVFRLLKKDTAADVFSYLSTETQANIIETISEKELSNIMEELYLDDTIDIIESMPSNVVAKILANAKAEKREEINRFLGYEENSAGSLMTNEYLDLKEINTVAEALNKIRKTAQNKETINYCYVLTKTRKLVGVVSIRDLILSEEDVKISEIMNDNIILVNTNTHESEVSDLFKKYDISTLPVVDDEERMVGIITVDDILDVIEDTATEDFEKMAGIFPSEESYLKTSILRHTKNRILWLALLMISAIFTGMLLTSFEDILSQELILIGFLPLLMSTAGNSGAQSSTLMIRGMTLGEIKFKDYFKVFFKETRISLLIGLGLALFNFARIMIQFNRFDLALAICATLILVVFIANILGFSMPLIANKFKLDPAVMSAPIITTILDFLVIIIYFTISSAILGLA